MAIIKRNKKWTIAIRPFGKMIWVTTGTTNKTRAQEIERQIVVGLKSGDFRALDPETRGITIALYRNQGWEMPVDLGGEAQEVTEVLTLGRAIELCKMDPALKTSNNQERIGQGFAHLERYFGKDFPIKTMWIPEVKQYVFQRQADGAAASTINKEKAALSRIFQVLMELRLVDVNPALMVKALSEKAGQREVYLSFQDFQRVLDALPEWFRSVVQVAYYTGMRRGEILGLTRDRVSLAKRMIFLRGTDTKEGKSKRVPIHKDLVPILEAAMKIQGMITPAVFLRDGRPITHRDQFRWCWDRQLAKLPGLEALRFHDLRHTWKTNAMRSGVDFEVREAILGHSNRAKSVSERYGFLDDATLLQAIDKMTFEAGETEIYLSAEKKPSRDISSERVFEKDVSKMLARAEN